MERLGLRDAVFFGLSIGGVVTQGLAAERPDLVRGAVLSNTAPKIGTEAIWRARIACVRAGGMAARAGVTMERWLARAYRTEKPEDVAFWRTMLARTPVSGYCGCHAVLADTDLRELTAALRRPASCARGRTASSAPTSFWCGVSATCRPSRRRAWWRRHCGPFSSGRRRRAATPPCAAGPRSARGVPRRRGAHPPEAGGWSGSGRSGS